MKLVKDDNEEYWTLSTSSRAMFNAGWTTEEVCAADHPKLIKFAQEYAKLMLPDLEITFPE